MKIGLMANPTKPAAVALVRRAAGRIGSSAELLLTDDLREVAPEAPHLPLENLRPDVLVAIGGDGTFLYALRRCSAPLLPINAGTAGILAEVEAQRPADVDSALDRLVSGHYFLEERMKLAAQLGSSPVPDAVNEFVLHAAQVGKMGLFELAFDGHVVGELQADGVILASPTGSTGYSLSSLGPIVDPGLDALVLTTIAPFRVEARALVVDPLRAVRIRSVDPNRAAVLIADGQAEYPLPPDSSVTVYRSPRRATLVRFGSRFFERLRGKRILPWTDAPPVDGASHADLPPPP